MTGRREACPILAEAEKRLAVNQLDTADREKEERRRLFFAALYAMEAARLSYKQACKETRRLEARLAAMKG